MSLIFTGLLTSCVTTSRVNYLQDIETKTSDSISLSSFPEYKLRVGDQVYVKLSTLDENSRILFSGGAAAVGSVTGSGVSGLDMFSYPIFSDGCIDYPFVGSIKLVGLTTREAKDTIKSKLLNIVPDCDIDVKLVNAFFSVIGDAGTGKFEITKEKLNVFQALAISGDLNSFSDRSKIKILRQTTQGTQVKVFDVRSKSIINSEFYYVLPNDVIYVQSFNGQFMGIESFASALTAVTSTFSMSYLLYLYIIPLFK